MKPQSRILSIGVLLIIGATAAGMCYSCWHKSVPVARLAINFIRMQSAPLVSADDRPVYVEPLTSERYFRLCRIGTANTELLRVGCADGTGRYSGFESESIVAHEDMIGATGHEIFSLNPANGWKNWRTNENYVQAEVLAGNCRDACKPGMLFRGTEDGRMLAYDVRTRKRVWETRIANLNLGESTLASPIAWKGLILAGNIGRDSTGLKRRMYAIEATTGTIVWEFLLVPKTDADLAHRPHCAMSLDLETWDHATAVPMTGSAIWASLTLDRATAGVYHDPIQAVPSGMARLVRLQRARTDPRAGRQEAPTGCSQGWASLWIQYCLQFPAMPYAGDPSRKL